MEHHFPPGNSTDRIESRRCMMCQGQMVLARTTPARLGFDFQTFECVQCSHVEKVLVAAGPSQSNVLGWPLGEFNPPN